MSNLHLVQERSERVPTENQNLHTICILCAHNCGLVVDIHENHIVNIRADATNPKSLGYSCNKGYTIDHYVHHAQRVTHPLRRNTATGQFEQVSWEAAIQEIGNRMKDVIQKYGGTAVALNGLGGQGNHLDIMYGISFLTSIGSPWFFCTFAQEKTQHTLVDRWMMNAPTHAILHADAWHSDYILVMGTNPLVSHRNERPTQLFSQISKKKDRRVVVVDPRVSETAKKADLHLPIVPGGDAYLLMGMIKHILEERLFQKDFVEKHTVGFDQLRKQFESVDIQEMARRCDLPADHIRQVAREFSTSKTACVFYDLGLEQIPYTTLVCWLTRVLLAITGNLAKIGGNVFTPQFKPMTDMFEPREEFRAPVSGIPAIPALGPMGMFSPNLLPEEIEAGNIRALIVEGANPLISYPDTNRYQAALRKLDLLVVVDPAFTETAREAHFVLPTPTGYEKWEWSNHNHRFPEIFAHLRRPVVQGPEQALPEAEIYSRIVQAIGSIAQPLPILRKLANKDVTTSKPFRAILIGSSLIRWRKNKLKAIAQITFWAYRLAGKWLPNPATAIIWLTCTMFAASRRSDALRTLGPKFKWKTPFAIGDELFRRIVENPQGVEVGRVDEHNHFRQMCRTPDHRVRLVPEPMIAEMKRALATNESRSMEFPLLLSAGERHFWNANTLQRDPSWRKGKGPHFGAKIHPEVAKSVGVNHGDLVRIVTRTNSLSAPAIVTDAVRRDCVSLPNGFGMEYPDANGNLVPVGGKINLLTDLDDRDPFTGIPHLKKVRCRIEKHV